MTTGGATFSNPAIFLSNVNINGVLAVSNVTYITSNIIVYNNEIINSNLFASNLVLAGSATVSNSLTILSNLNIANALTLNGIALSKRNTAGLTNITTLAITGYSYSSNGVGLTGSNFITFSGSNSEFARYNGNGFLGINTTAPTGYIDVRNFARHPVEGLTWTSSNSLSTAYTAPMDTNSNLTIKILSSSASNTTLLSTAFSASNNAFLSSNNVYNASGVPNATIQTLVAGSNYSGEWIELDMPSAIVANEIYINANASTFTLAASSNANATFALLYYTNSNTPYTPAFYDFSTNTTPYSNYRLIINRTTTNNSNISVTTFKVYGSAASNPATTIDNDTLTVSKGTLTVNGGMQVNTDTINFANSNGPIEFPPAPLSSSATTTLTGQTYGSGTYTPSAGSFMTGRPPWQVFDKSSNALSIWTSATESYNASTGTYTSTTLTTTLANGVSIAGEWLQIQLPQSIILQNFIIAPTPGTFTQSSTTYSYAQVRSPNTFTVLGSENGTSWQIVSSTTNVNNWDTTGTGASKTFTVAAQPTTPAYKYYRMVIQSIGQTYIGAAGNYYAELAEWRLFGTFPAALLTSERNVVVNNNLGILNNNPQYPLDIAGDLNFTGTLRQGGAPYVGSQFSNIGNNVFLTGSNLGLGKSNPAYTLDVVGGVNITNGSGNGGVTTGLTVTTQVGSDSTTSESIILQQSTGNATSRQAITWRNTTFYNYSMARIWSQVGGGYAATMMGFDVADSARNMQTRVVIDVNGNVGIGTASPVTNLHVAGSIFARDGLYRTKSKYLTGSYSANTWYNVFNGTSDPDLTTGVYILKGYCETHAAGGQMYSMTHSGIFSWYAGGTNSSNGEGITTHRSGHAPNNEVVSFRTLQISGGVLYLQIYTNFNWTLDSTGGKTVLIEVTRIA